MIAYSVEANKIKSIDGIALSCFSSGANVDEKTVAAFKDEWEKFSQFREEEIETIGDEYFDLLEEIGWNSSWNILDAGCGSGRWSRYLSSRVSFVEAIDPVAAEVAVAQNKDIENLRVTEAGIDQIPFGDKTFDGAICLGVLHHMPDTKSGLQQIVNKLKSGGWVLLYLYYALDNRGKGYRMLFQLSTSLRLVISTMSEQPRNFVCDLIAVFIYLPIVIFARIVKRLGGKYQSLPLSYYTGKSFYIMRNDARDRFGTPLEKRFSKEEIEEMMEACGLNHIKFSDTQPFWCVMGYRP